MILWNMKFSFYIFNGTTSLQFQEKGIVKISTIPSKKLKQVILMTQISN